MSNETAAKDSSSRNGQSDRDISRTMEDTLQGAFSLIGAVSITTWDYFAHPSRLSAGLSTDSPTPKYARPVTFFLVICLLTVCMFELEFATLRKLGRLSLGAIGPIEKLFIEGVTTFDFKKLVWMAIPLLSALGLYSLAMTKSAKRRSLDLGFEMSLALACYGAGSLLLIYLLMIPPMFYLYPRAISGMPWWGYAIGVVGGVLIVACVRSYLSVLQGLLRISRRRTFSVLLGALWRFSLWYCVVLIWFFPFGIAWMR